LPDSTSKPGGEVSIIAGIFQSGSRVRLNFPADTGTLLMMQRFKKLLAQPWVFPLALLGIGLVSYCLHVSQLGFYWDDWQAVFLSRLTHPGQYVWEFFANDRPVSAWTYAVLLPILGMKPAAWQIVTLLARWGGTLCIYGTLVAIWPARAWQARWVAALLLVFPGFTMQPISAAFNQHFITFLAFGISFLTMALAVRDPRRTGLWLTLSILSGLVDVFTMEYFAALEGLRPIILWILLRKPGEPLRQTLLRTLKYWAPFAVMFAVFAYWRFIYYPGAFSGDIRNGLTLLQAFRSAPLKAAQTFANAILQDSAYLFVRAWTDPLGPTVLNLTAPLLPWLAAILAAAVFGLLAALAFQHPGPNEPARSDVSILLLGLVAFLLGALPVWMTARQVIVGKWSSRLALGPMLGVVIVLVFLIDAMLRSRPWKNALLAGLLLLSVAAQITNTQIYEKDWDTQLSTYWQLSWRMPSLAPGTAILSSEIPANSLSDYATAFAVLSIYADKLPNPHVPYWFLTPRSVGSSFAQMAPGFPIHYQVRDVVFDGSTSDAVAIGFPKGACLRVLDPFYASDPTLSDRERGMIPVSNLSRVGQTPHPPDGDIFGREPAHDWCFYFQKADLARQNQAWQQVIDLNAQAAQNHKTPRDGAELLPLIEAYARTGQWSQALDASRQAQEVTDQIGPLLCTTWASYAKLPSTPGQGESVQNALKSFGCGS
jgi:hypothetical protein